jgi:chaperone required for assembly of F1-ATPase
MQKVVFKLIRRNFSTKRKKFYQMVDIMEVSNKDFLPQNTSEQQIDTKLISLGKLKESFYHIMLDKKKCLSAYQDEFLIPSKQLAIAIAAEYQRQKEFIDFNYMPLVKIE